MDNATANEKYIEFRECPNEDEDAPTMTKLVRPTIVFINIVKTQYWHLIIHGNIIGHSLTF